MNKFALAMAALGTLPLTLGTSLRRTIYSKFLRHMGTNVVLYPAIDFQGVDAIELHDNVTIRSHVAIRRIGDNGSILIHDNVSIDSGVNIRTYRDSCLTIGANTVIGPYTCLSGGNLTIGTDCMIASHVSIYANNHNFSDATRKIREQGSSLKGISIEADCWLGTGVKVVDGVTIGQGSVVGAGAVVTKSIPPYSIAVGVPAKVVGQRGGDRPTAVHPSALNA